MQAVKENAKALIAFLTAFGTWGATAAPNGIDTAEWFGLTGPFVAGLTVWAVANAPSSDQLRELANWKRRKS